MSQDQRAKPSDNADLPDTESSVTQHDVNKVLADPAVSPDMRDKWLKRALKRLQEDANPGAEQRRLIREVRDIVSDKRNRR